MKSVLFVGLLLMVIGCAPTNNKGDVVKSIAEAEKNLYGDGKSFNFDNDKAAHLIEQYNLYASSFKDDAATPNYLFKAAEIKRSLRKYKDAIDYYDRICKDYADYEKAPHSLFLMGFSYENDLKNLTKAKECYLSFMNQYPKHDLADDVSFSLEHLGKSPEEIIKEFEQKEAAKN